jgi:hypothetical protein
VVRGGKSGGGSQWLRFWVLSCWGGVAVALHGREVARVPPQPWVAGGGG